jgi:hypothetical protein
MRFEVSPGFLPARKAELPKSCAAVAAVLNGKYEIFYESPDDMVCRGRGRVGMITRLLLFL